MKTPKKRTVFGIIILAVIAAIIVLHIYASQPAVGVVNQEGSTQTTSTNVFNDTLINVSDRYVSFSYPKSLQKDPNNPQYPPQVDQFNFSYKDSQTWNLAISIDNVSYGITGNSGYMLRKNNPEQYSETTEIINAIPIYIFTDKTAAGFGKVAFMQKGTFQATVSLVGDDFGGENNLQKSFNQILNSWHWFVS